MSRRLVLYVGSNVAVAIVLLALFPLDWRSAMLLHFLGWVAINVVAESLWLPTITGEGTDSMASAANFATVVLWGVTPAIWIVAVSTAISDLLIRRRPAIRVLFNTAAMVIVMTLAGLAFQALGGPPHGVWTMLEKAGRLEIAQMIGLLIPLLGLGVVYRSLNIVLVSVAAAWGAERPIRLVLREDFLYAEQIISDLALLFLSPLMVVSYAMLAYGHHPVLHAAARDPRFAPPLRPAQEGAGSARAHRAHGGEGQMAAEIGPRSRTTLRDLGARADALMGSEGRARQIARHARIIMEQASGMAILTKGLMSRTRR